MKENEITAKILGCAYKVHSQLGPGLLESAYEICLAHELKKANLSISLQKEVPIRYDNLEIKPGYRLDIVVEEKVIIEIKSVEALAPIHQAQLITYLKFTGISVGLLINFNVPSLKEGIKRVVWNFKNSID